MAEFYIQAFAVAEQVAQGDEIGRDRVDFSGGEVVSTLENTSNGPWYCRISTDTNCQYARGTGTPTLEDGSAPLWANQVEHVWLGRGEKFAVGPVRP